MAFLQEIRRRHIYNQMAQSTLFKVFVYGTLKRGEPNHHWLTNTKNGYSKFISEGTTITKFPLVIGTRYNIPFLLDRKEMGNNVMGEIYEVDKDMMGNLDILEDYPKYYDREIQDISTSQGIIPCWLYLLRNFPETMLSKKFLTSYKNTSEQPYCESYLESSPDDLRGDT